MIRWLVAIVACTTAGPVAAQGLNYAHLTLDPSVSGVVGGPPLNGPVNLSRAYVGVNELNGTVIGAPGFVSQSGAIRLADLLDASGAVSRPEMSSALTSIAARLDRFADRFREGIALAGAINVLPPDPGKHLNISVGAAGYDGTGAGSIAVSYRLHNDVIGYVGVARGPTQTLVKGGFGWSPW